MSGKTVPMLLEEVEKMISSKSFKKTEELICEAERIIKKSLEAAENMDDTKKFLRMKAIDAVSEKISTLKTRIALLKKGG